MLNRQVTLEHGVIQLVNHYGNFYITIMTTSQTKHAIISILATNIEHQWKHYYNYAVNLDKVINQIIRQAKIEVANQIYESL
jgi:hypothetical protein